MNTDVIRTLSGYYEKAEYLESLLDIRQGMQEQYTEDQYRVSGRANRNRKYRNIAIVCGGVIAFPQFVTPLLGMDPVLPGFGGVVPSTAKDKLGIDATDQGHWCSLLKSRVPLLRSRSRRPSCNNKSSSPSAVIDQSTTPFRS